MAGSELDSLGREIVMMGKLSVALTGVVLALGGFALVAAANATASATIVVEVPADAKVYFDDQPTEQTGAVRTFVTPPLRSDKAFMYNLRVEVVRQDKVVAQTEQISVRAGQTTRVDLKQPKSTPMAGYVYTITNDASQNAVAVLRRGEDGSLTEVSGSPFAAGGKGLTDGTADGAEPGFSLTRLRGSGNISATRPIYCSAAEGKWW
jgi:uncharacterized protein (TIGR03000 family)